MSYIPNFIPSPVPCLAPSFIEHRSRCAAGGTFFRSKEQGQLNNIAVHVTVTNYSTNSTTIVDDIECLVKVLGTTIETYNVQQTGTYNASLSVWEYGGSGFNNLRSAINGNATSIIQMPVRGYDVEDVAGIDDDVMVSFSGSFSGGVGGPTDGGGIDSIRTGPTQTIIILRSTEADNGSSITPPSNRRVQRWDGTQWTTYTPSPT